MLKDDAIVMEGSLDCRDCMCLVTQKCFSVATQHKVVSIMGINAIHIGSTAFGFGFVFV